MDIVKKEIAVFMKSLPKNATWEDVIYEAYVREKIGNARKEVEEGKTVLHEDVKKRVYDLLNKK